MEFIHPLSNSIFSALCELQSHGAVQDISSLSENGIDLISATYLLSIPQYPKEPGILSKEVVVFEAKEGDVIPIPYFQRENFPRLPHLLRNTGLRKSPCLYTAKPEQIALQWNALQYVHRVGEWLEKVSDGTLHESDQALEDIMLIDGGKCIVPTAYRLGVPHNFVREKSFENGSCIFYLEQEASKENTSYEFIEIDIGTVSHSAIVAAPNTLEELNEILLSGSEDVCLRSVLHTLFQSTSENHKRKLFFFVKAEVQDDIIDRKDRRTYAFVTDSTIQEIGEKIGALSIDPETYNLSYGYYFGQLPSDINLNIPVLGLTIHDGFSPIMGRFTNGIPLETDTSRVLQIGVGAVGSQIARNLTQAGFTLGWTCLDNDMLLPHNLSRFICPPSTDSVGTPKVNIIAESLNRIAGIRYCEPALSSIKFGEIDETIINWTREQNAIIIDTSASVSVQRTLDHCIGNTNNRFTAFLSPNGKSICLFSTKKGSGLTHTMLEVYFYSALVSNERLHELLETEQEGFTYSGDSCRAISARISTHDVSMFSAIASSFIQNNQVLEEDQAIILKKNGFKIEETVLPISPFSLYENTNTNGINIFVSPYLIKELIEIRKEKLPCETGGVLIGTYDPITKSIFVVNHLYAPIDSTSSPTHFHRGVKGVDEKLDFIEKVTHKQIGYIGEWHSHPNNTATTPSQTDEKLLEWLRGQSKSLTYPFLMLIQGDEGFNISI